MSWIWLDEKAYPECQKSYYNINSCSRESRKKFTFTVAKFQKNFTFDEEISEIKFRVSADSSFRLFVNKVLTQIGPTSPGGDFLLHDKYPHYFADIHTVSAKGNKFEISALVKLLPIVLTEYSKGHGGFFCELEFKGISGKTYSYETDETWFSERVAAYTDDCIFDSSLNEKDVTKAVITEDIWHLRNSYIPSVSLNTVYEKKFNVNYGESKEINIVLPKIYGIIPHFSSNGKCKANLIMTELEGQETTEEKVKFGKGGEYVSFRMHSMGEAKLKIENIDCNSVSFYIKLIAPWYPFKEEGYFQCSDSRFNKIYDVCKHTLKICRQSIHLDSTKHQEHLACTGDYNIESLVTLFAFDDMRLAEFDVMRTADWIYANDGRMFHTTYSLIWVRMLYNLYMITGKMELITYCLDAVNSLFAKFDSYFTDSGVIENPPDYMFVDWTVIDGYSMHHPPKALGQTVLNAFYYDALLCAEKIFGYLNENEKVREFSERSKKFKVAFNREFLDRDKKMYFDGKNDESIPSDWEYNVKNSNKIYISKYPNILACAFGLIEGNDAKELLNRVIFDEKMQDIQPYFAHYLLEAVKKNGLESEHAIKIFEKWIPVVDECDKGLAEGWIAPQPDYKFDHSHAWGGTVAYQLPAIISGLKILEPGMKKISFSKNLLTLDYAKIKFFTPYGMATAELTKNDTSFVVPSKVEVVIE